jgi:hypothetical protein
MPLSIPVRSAGVISIRLRHFCAAPAWKRHPRCPTAQAPRCGRLHELQDSWSRSCLLCGAQGRRLQAGPPRRDRRSELLRDRIGWPGIKPPPSTQVVNLIQTSVDRWLHMAGPICRKATRIATCCCVPLCKNGRAGVGCGRLSCVCSSSLALLSQERSPARFRRQQRSRARSQILGLTQAQRHQIRVACYGHARGRRLATPRGGYGT